MQQADGRSGQGTLIGAATTTLVHAACAGRYDLFRDELYFIVCGQHPAFGYVDQPPLVPLLAAALHTLGDGPFWLRLPPALAAGALVWLAVRFVVLLGGGTLAALIAGAAVGIAPMMVGLTTLLNTTAFDPLLWTGIAYCLARAIRSRSSRALVLAGVLAGLDLEIKYAMVFWAVALGVGLVATPQRRIVTRRAFWLGLALGALIALPSFVWQAAHGFPFLELSAAARGKNAEVAPGAFLANQLVVMNPALAPVWLAGLVGPFVRRDLRDMRFLPLAWLALLAITLASHGKDYYMAAAYPVLFVLGAVSLAPLARAFSGRIALSLTAAAALAISLAIAPIVLPILPPERLVDWMQSIGFTPQAQEKTATGAVLPQSVADQLGWRDFTAQVLAAWNRVPPAERPRTAILASNYGEAGALDVLGAGRGLPPALSGHNQYWLWGQRGQDPANLLIIDDDLADYAGYCTRLTVLGETRSRWAMAYENHRPIALCEGTRRPLAAVWAAFRAYR